MNSPAIDDIVRLKQDLPELRLCRGDVGVVRSTWFAPTVAYEVEFHAADDGHELRALLLEEQLQLEDAETSRRFHQLAKVR